MDGCLVFTGQGIFVNVFKTEYGSRGTANTV